MSYELESDTPLDIDDQGNRYSATNRQAAMNIRSRGSFADPFSPSMNTVFFSGADRRVLLDEVIHLCQFGNNLVAVIGEDGVGKSSLLAQAHFELSESACCCFVKAEEEMSAQALFTQIISQLDLSSSASATAGEMIAHLRHAIAEGNLHRIVLIIDDAHQLNDGILSALISLLQGHQGQHLHILLSGELTLVERLDCFDMVDVLVYDVTLKPFSLGETKEYLDFKLTTAGHSTDLLLSDSEVQRIWKESQGNVATINHLAANYLYQQDMGIEDDERPATGLPLVHMALLVVLLAALILALIYLGGDEDESSLEVGATPTNELQQTTPIDLPLNAGVDNSVSDKGIEQQNEAAQVSTSPLKEEVPTTPSAPIEPNTASDPQSQASEQPVETVSQARVASSGAVSVAQGDGKKAEEKRELDTAQPESIQAVAPTLKQELQKEVATLEQPEKPTRSTTQLTKDEAWLASLPDQHYVLQVLAAGQKSSVEQFIRSQPNQSALHLIEVVRNAKPWFIVVTGDFADGDLARRAINTLPQSQVNSGPWPRKVSDIKREMAAYRNK